MSYDTVANPIILVLLKLLEECLFSVKAFEENSNYIHTFFANICDFTSERNSLFP